MSRPKRPFKITGVNSLRRVLRQAPEEMKSPLQQAVLDSLADVESTMLSNVPRDSGDLASVIKSKPQRDKMSGIVGPGVRGKRDMKKAGWRAKFIEFGTQHHPAQPFVAKSFYQNKDTILDRLQKGVAKALVAIAGKADT